MIMVGLQSKTANKTLKWGLRKAQILDDYGDDSFAKMSVNHNNPDDVKREEFDYYG